LLQVISKDKVGNYICSIINLTSIEMSLEEFKGVIIAIVGVRLQATSSVSTTKSTY